MSHLWASLTSPADAALVGLLSLILGSLSFIVTVGGFYIAIRTIKQAKSAAQATTEESRRILAELNRYDSVKEVNLALSSLRSASKHFKNLAWVDVAESYDEASLSLGRLKVRLGELNPEWRKEIDKIIRFNSKLHEQIETIDISDTTVKSKIHAALRQHLSKVYASSLFVEQEVIK